MEICQKGDQLLDEEIAKVYKGKKINKGAFLDCQAPGSGRVLLTRRPRN